MNVTKEHIRYAVLYGADKGSNAAMRKICIFEVYEINY